MNKLKLLLLLVCLAVLAASPALSAQIGGKALGDVDDVVKEATHGNLEIPKHSLMLLRYGQFSENTELRWIHNYSQANVLTFNNAGNTAMKTVQVLSNDFGSYYQTPALNVAPTISRRSYNGKKVVMWNISYNEKSFLTNFAALQNSRTSSTENPRELVNSLSASPIGNPIETIIPYDVWPYVVHVFGGLVLNVKGYDGEVFVSTCGIDELNQFYGLPAENFNVFLNFFGVHADDSGDPACTQFDLTHKMWFTGGRKNVVTVATDIDDDGYTDDFVVLVNTNSDIRLYFYKVVYENGTFKLKRHGNDEYKLYTSPEPYGQWFNEDASSELITGDFDGDGKYEVRRFTRP